jgi:uncharacterized protein (DUF4415 family)
MKNKPDNVSQEDWDAVDSPEVDDKLFKKMKPAQEVFPQIPSRVRGPQNAPKKIPVSIRLNEKVVQYFKAHGKGWQTEIDSILLDYIKTH